MAPQDFKSISVLVEDAFSGDSGSKEFAEKFLDVVLENWRDAASAQRRTITLGVLLAVVFVLLAGTTASVLTLGPLRLSNPREVLPLVPAIVGFLYYEAMLLTVAGNFYGEVMTQMLRHTRPEIYESKLYCALAPATASIWGADWWRNIRRRPPTRLTRVDDRFEGAFGLVYLVAVPGFIVYAYWWLFHHTAVERIAIWASLVFCAVNIFRAILVLVDRSASAR